MSPAALVSWRGNHYSVPPGLSGAIVAVTHRLGSELIGIVTASGAVVAAHPRALDGAGATRPRRRAVAALEKAVLAAFTTAKPCTHKTCRPPSAAALVEAARLRGQPATDPAHKVVIDFAAYAATAAGLSVAPQADPIEEDTMQS